MSFHLEWAPQGAIKHFAGYASFNDVYLSECEIQRSPDFDHLRYVISVFDGDGGLALTKLECEHVLAMRLGAKHSNPRIKYAYVSISESVRIAVEETVRRSNSAFPVKVFDDLHAAMGWATEC